MDLFLIIAAAVVVWIIRAYLVPFAPCRRCQGRKVNRFSGKRRYGLCGSCGGTGSRQVLGSKAVHKAVRSILAYRSKEK